MRIQGTNDFSNNPQFGSMAGRAFWGTLGYVKTGAGYIKTGAPIAYNGFVDKVGPVIAEFGPIKPHKLQIIKNPKYVAPRSFAKEGKDLFVEPFKDAYRGIKKIRGRRLKKVLKWAFIGTIVGATALGVGHVVFPAEAFAGKNLAGQLGVVAKQSTVGAFKSIQAGLAYVGGNMGEGAYWLYDKTATALGSLNFEALGKAFTAGTKTEVPGWAPPVVTGAAIGAGYGLFRFMKNRPLGKIADASKWVVRRSVKFMKKATA